MMALVYRIPRLKEKKEKRVGELVVINLFEAAELCSLIRDRVLMHDSV